MTNVYTTATTTQLNYEITLIGSHPMLNNGGSSRVHMRLNNVVRGKPGRKLNHVVHRFNRRHSNGTRPNSCCRSRGGRSFVTTRGGVALCTSRHTITMGVRNSHVTSIAVRRVRANRRARLATPLFDSYANSTAVNCLTNTS